MAEHTATPWIARTLGDDCFVEGNEVAGKTISGEYKREILSDESYPKKKGDVRFIIKACNHFDEMYEALKTMTALVRLKYGNLDKNVWERIQEVENLLARIEGEK
jgi:CheY-specific phosphatase CheX